MKYEYIAITMFSSELLHLTVIDNNLNLLITTMNTSQSDLFDISSQAVGLHLPAFDQVELEAAKKMERRLRGEGRRAAILAQREQDRLRREKIKNEQREKNERAMQISRGLHDLYEYRIKREKEAIRANIQEIVRETIAQDNVWFRIRFKN